MRFILTADWENGVAALTERLTRELAADKKVLWLTSGGSNIAASVQVMQGIPETLSQGLSVMPADERYGEPGHANSNWQQLMEAGFMPREATLLPVLKTNQSFEQAAEYYDALTETAFASHDIIIIQLGIGDDGHILGILPDSPVIQAEETLVFGYQSIPYQRLTLTFKALRQATAVYGFAFGDNKRLALSDLKNKALPLSQQPAQILKELGEAYIYNDQVGETA